LAEYDKKPVMRNQTLAKLLRLYHYFSTNHPQHSLSPKKARKGMITSIMKELSIGKRCAYDYLIFIESLSPDICSKAHWTSKAGKKQNKER